MHTSITWNRHITKTAQNAKHLHDANITHT